MIGFIIWIIGVVLTIKAAIEIWNLNVDPVKKIVVIVLLVPPAGSASPSTTW